jgi:hypothetical protein
MIRSNERSVQIMNLQMTKEDVEHFYGAVIGRHLYDSSATSISAVETFLIYWLNGEEYEGKQACMKMLYEQCRHVFSYTGYLYRGIEMNTVECKEKGLHYTGYSSFTDVEEVARQFAGNSDMYCKSNLRDSIHFLIEGEVEEAFALDDLLDVLMHKTENIDLVIVIEERIWENEKIYPCSLEDFEIRQLEDAVPELSYIA